MKILHFTGLELRQGIGKRISDSKTESTPTVSLRPPENSDWLVGWSVVDTFEYSDSGSRMVSVSVQTWTGKGQRD